LIKPDDEGIKYPVPIPAAMVRNIHKVRYLSKKLSFFRSATGAQLFADIICRIRVDDQQQFKHAA